MGLYRRAGYDAGRYGNRRRNAQSDYASAKNGFFYVLDRETGELLRANSHVTVNWASHIDMETERPVENASRTLPKATKSQWICRSAWRP